MKSIRLFPAALATMFLVCGCASVSERRESASSAPMRTSTAVRREGVVALASYHVASMTSFTGYIRPYFSTALARNPRTYWYLDGRRKGLVKDIKSARFKTASRTEHTVSFTCVGDHRPPLPVTIDLLSYQKVSIAVRYR